MSPTTTRDALGIFWGGEERAGCTAYGYWPVPNAPQPDSPLDRWPPGTRIRYQHLGGDGWTVWVVDILTQDWPAPSSWAPTVSATLLTMRNSGAVMAWFGLEGCFADPPELFVPEHMSGGVWAATAGTGPVYGPPAIDAPFTTLPNQILLQLCQEARLRAPEPQMHHSRTSPDSAPGRATDLLRTVERALAGTIDLHRASSQISRLRTGAGEIPDELLLSFRAVDSELDSVPIGDAAKLWNPDALADAYAKRDDCLSRRRQALLRDLHKLHQYLLRRS